MTQERIGPTSLDYSGAPAVYQHRPHSLKILRFSRGLVCLVRDDPPELLMKTTRTKCFDVWSEMRPFCQEMRRINGKCQGLTPLAPPPLSWLEKYPEEFLFINFFFWRKKIWNSHRCLS